MSNVSKLPSGNWRARVYVGCDSNGKKKYKSITAATKKEAMYKAREYELMTERYSDSLNITFSQAIDSYIESKSNVLSPATIRGYRMIKRHRLLSLMDKPICTITHQDIQRAINLEALELSPKTVKNIHGLLSAVFKVYRPDFALHTSLPKKQKREMHIPDDEEISRLIDIVRGSELYLPVLLSSMLSLRRSEISALTWNDINFITKKLTVRKAMVLSIDKEWIIKDPKTFNSYRTITIPDLLVNELKLYCGKPEEAVTRLNPDMITIQFGRMIRKNNFELFRFHDLRHYNASVMLALNLPDKYAMERGGWSTPSTMKNIYQHTFENRSEKYDALIAEYFNQVFTTDDTKMTRN